MIKNALTTLTSPHVIIVALQSIFSIDRLYAVEWKLKAGLVHAWIQFSGMIIYPKLLNLKGLVSYYYSVTLIRIE